MKGLFVTLSINDNQHNDMQHKEILHKGLICDDKHEGKISKNVTQHNIMPSVVRLSVLF
jgi:hypothetical protein